MFSSIRCLTFVVALLAVLAVAHAAPLDYDVSGTKFSKLESGEKALLREYHKNYLRLKAFYENITLKVRERTFMSAGPGRGLKLDGIRDFTFRANGGDYYRMDGIRYEVDEPSKEIRSMVGIIAPSGDYLLQKNPAGKYFVLVHAKNKEMSLGEMDGYLFQIAPFSYEIRPIDQYLYANTNVPGGTVDGVALVRDSGDDLVVVTTSRKKGKSWNREVARFYHDKSWALKDIRTDATVANDDSIICTIIQSCSYQGERDSVPLLKTCSVEYWAKLVATGETFPSQRQEFEVLKIVPGPVALADFDVDTLLGKMKVGTQTAFPRFRVICIALGVVFLLVGILLRRRAVRARA